jgi:hypothetical protein
MLLSALYPPAFLAIVPPPHKPRTTAYKPRGDIYGRKRKHAAKMEMEVQLALEEMLYVVCECAREGGEGGEVLGAWSALQERKERGDYSHTERKQQFDAALRGEEGAMEKLSPKQTEGIERKRLFDAALRGEEGAMEKLSPKQTEGIERKRLFNAATKGDNQALLQLPDQMQATALSRRQLEIPLETIQAHFHLSQVDASRVLNVHLATMRRIVKRHGIKRWPQRQVQHALTHSSYTIDDLNAMGTSQRAKTNLVLIGKAKPAPVATMVLTKPAPVATMVLTKPAPVATQKQHKRRRVHIDYHLLNGGSE